MNSNHFFHLKVIVIVIVFLFVGIFPARQTHAASGTLFGWGNNGFANLGLGWYRPYTYSYTWAPGETSPTYVLSPTQVGTTENWASISAGNYFVMGIKTDGTLWGWGINYSGNLGLGSGWISPSYDPALPSTAYLALSPTQTGTDTNWSSVSSGDNFVLAVKTNGTLWAWGENSSGQLGFGDTNSRSSPTQVGTDTNWSSVVGKISGGYANSAAIKTDGTLWVWGNDIFGETGQGNTTGAISRYYPTQVGTATNWDKVSAMGQFTVLATKTDGTLWAWGDNMYGQLGLGYADYSGNGQHSVPVQVGTETNWSGLSQGDTYSMAMKTNGTLWVWGRVVIPFAVNTDQSGGYGQTGSPTQVGTDTNWRNFAAYPYPTGVAAIKTDGTLWGWGANYAGNLGLGDTVTRNSPTQVGTGTDWGSVTVGIYGTMAIRVQVEPPLQLCLNGIRIAGATEATPVVTSVPVKLSIPPPSPTATLKTYLNNANDCSGTDVTNETTFTDTTSSVVSLSSSSATLPSVIEAIVSPPRVITVTGFLANYTDTGKQTASEQIQVSRNGKLIRVNVDVEEICSYNCVLTASEHCSTDPQFTITDSCDYPQLCDGKRYCDYNYKEAAP